MVSPGNGPPKGIGDRRNHQDVSVRTQSHRGTDRRKASETGEIAKMFRSAPKVTGDDVTRYGAEVLLTGGTEYVDVFDAAEFDRACAEVMMGPLFDSFYDTLREHCADLIETNHARAAAAVARHKEETGCDLRID